MKTIHLCDGAWMESTIEYNRLSLTINFARRYIPQEILKNIPLIDNCYRFNHFENQNIAFFFCPTLSESLINKIYPKNSYEENLNRIEWFNNGTILAMERYYPQILMHYPSALENLQKSVDKQYLL